MSRDEARHAGFLNKAMSDFNVSLDLCFNKTRKIHIFWVSPNLFFTQHIYPKIGYLALYYNLTVI